MYIAGPCQFPTLGFVVARYEQVEAFVPEKFWYIHMSLTRPGSSDDDGENQVVEFTWKRGNLFEYMVALVIYEGVMRNPLARVVKVTRKSTKKWFVLVFCPLRHMD